MEKETMQTTQNQPPVLRQIVGAVLGLVLAVASGYHGLEFVFALLVLPIIIAGIVRLVIGLYRVIGKFTGRKAYDELGQCVVVIPRPGITSVLAIVGFACILNAVASILRLSKVAGLTLFFALLALEIYIFLRDFRSWKQHKNQN